MYIYIYKSRTTQVRNKVKVNENAKQRKMWKRTTGFSLLWYDALLCVATGTAAATRLIRVRAKYYLYSIIPRTRHTEYSLPFRLLVTHGMIRTSDDAARVCTFTKPTQHRHLQSETCRFTLKNTLPFVILCYVNAATF